jgi:hypothetical protein
MSTKSLPIFLKEVLKSKRKTNPFQDSLKDIELTHFFNLSLTRTMIMEPISSFGKVFYIGVPKGRTFPTDGTRGLAYLANPTISLFTSNSPKIVSSRPKRNSEDFTYFFLLAWHLLSNQEWARFVFMPGKRSICRICGESNQEYSLTYVSKGGGMWWFYFGSGYNIQK